MNPSNEQSPAPKAEWISPPREQEGLSRYLQTIRERLRIVILTVAITTGVAILYVATTAKTYEAEAGMLVTPVPAESELLVRVGLLSGSIDPARDIQTIARLVTTSQVAERAQAELSGVPEAQGTPQDVLRHVEAEPVAESNIVAITASAGDPEDSAEIANVFATSLIEERSDELHARVEEQLGFLRPQLDRGAPDDTLSQQVTELEALLAGQDPTLQLATEALAPTEAAAPRPLLSIVGGLLAGLVLGLGAAFAYQAIDPRLRREDQLRRLYRLPILARIPREHRRRGGPPILARILGSRRRASERPLAPGELSPAASEAYRTLRGTLAVSDQTDGSGGRAILIAGSSPSDGKTTTAVNLAASLAQAGSRVILIEADQRRPAIGTAFGVQPKTGVVNVMLEKVPLEEALVTSTPYGEHLGLLLADVVGDTTSEIFGLPSAKRMLDEARRLADYVIIDSPPLTDVVDALPLARQADQVLLIARLGNTRMAKLSQLGELLAENGIRPVGMVIVGTARPSRREDQYYRQAERRLAREAAESRPPRRPRVRSRTSRR